MSRHTPDVCLRDIRAFIKEAVGYVDGIEFEEFNNDRKLTLATEKLVEMIAEAANRLGREYHNAHPEVPWRDIVGMRNKLVHDYDLVDNDVLYETLTRSLPSLVPAIEKLLAAEQRKG